MGNTFVKDNKISFKGYSSSGDVTPDTSSSECLDEEIKKGSTRISSKRNSRRMSLENPVIKVLKNPKRLSVFLNNAAQKYDDIQKLEHAKSCRDIFDKTTTKTKMTEKNTSHVEEDVYQTCHNLTDEEFAKLMEEDSPSGAIEKLKIRMALEDSKTKNFLNQNELEEDSPTKISHNSNDSSNFQTTKEFDTIQNSSENQKDIKIQKNNFIDADNQQITEKGTQKDSNNGDEIGEVNRKINDLDNPRSNASTEDLECIANNMSSIYNDIKRISGNLNNIYYDMAFDDAQKNTEKIPQIRSKTFEEKTSKMEKDDNKGSDSENLDTNKDVFDLQEIETEKNEKVIELVVIDEVVEDDMSLITDNLAGLYGDLDLGDDEEEVKKEKKSKKKSKKVKEEEENDDMDFISDNLAGLYGALDLGDDE